MVFGNRVKNTFIHTIKMNYTFTWTQNSAWMLIWQKWTRMWPLVASFADTDPRAAIIPALTARNSPCLFKPPVMVYFVYNRCVVADIVMVCSALKRQRHTICCSSPFFKKMIWGGGGHLKQTIQRGATHYKMKILEHEVTDMKTWIYF